MSQAFNNKPSLMDKTVFIKTFGGVYEHSVWIAETVFNEGISDKEDTIDSLSLRLQTVLANADKEDKL